jgi:hypothetical protein
MIAIHGFRTMQKVYLIVAKGKQKGFPVPIGIDLFLIGTRDICQLRSKLPGIGEEHCAIVTRDRKVFVRDMTSGEPTILNEKIIPPGEEWPLHPRDRLVVGPLEFLVQFREKPLSQRDLEEWAAKCLDVASEDIFEEVDDDFRRPPTDASEAAGKILERLQKQRGIVMGRLRIGRDAGVTIVRFNDIYLVEEAEIALVNKELRENLARPQLRVLLDCKNVKRMSTAAVNTIGELAQWLKSWGSTLAMCRVRPGLIPILGELSTHNIPLFPDKKTALRNRW